MFFNYIVSFKAVIYKRHESLGVLLSNGGIVDENVKARASKDDVNEETRMCLSDTILQRVRKIQYNKAYINLLNYSIK